ncbi:MAG: hypothetical protein ACYTFG_13220 [Planctomycetota bacterium]|jgi:hypothetical protein
MSAKSYVSTSVLISVFLFSSTTVQAAPGHFEGLAEVLPCLMGQDEGWGWEGEEETPEPQPGGEESPSEGGDEWGEGGGWDDSPPPDEGPPPEVERSELRGKGKKLSLSLWILGAMPIGGEAGSGTDAPGWTDAYGLGFGGGGMFGLRLVPCLDVRLGAYYQSLPSKGFDAVGVENELSSFSMFGVGLGFRFYILMDRPVGQWFGKSSKPYLGPAFFLGFDFGVGFSSAVTWDTPSPSWDYWDAGTLLVQELVLGVDYRFAESIGALLELGFPTSSGPSGADGPADPLNDAGSLSAFRFKMGLLFAF